MSNSCRRRYGIAAAEPAGMDASPCTSTGAARRRREQQVRADARRVSWLVSLCQTACSHHTGGHILSLVDSVARLQQEVSVLQQSLPRTSAQGPKESQGSAPADLGCFRGVWEVMHQCFPLEEAEATTPASMEVDRNAEDLGGGSGPLGNSTETAEVQDASMPQCAFSVGDLVTVSSQDSPNFGRCGQICEGLTAACDEQGRAYFPVQFLDTREVREYGAHRLSFVVPGSLPGKRKLDASAGS